MENIKFFSLPNIADWQLNPNKESIDLPELQRGFVWKPAQIEKLWDSLLRGFPIGSFLMSKDSNEKLFILDGQQRATSIALGYYNPWQKKYENKKLWSIKNNLPVLWIDLLPKDKTTAQKFLIKIVTRSHPWGYQTVDNESRLSLSDRREAMKHFRINPANKDKGYSFFELTNVFPYDSCLPVPLSFLISLEQDKCWKNHLFNSCKEYFPNDYIKTKHLKRNYFDKLENFLSKENSDKYLVTAVKNLNSFNIPSIIANKEILKDEDEQTGDDPTLFIRLNLEGTPISNEDLIYSIYKASFRNSKNLVEKIGMGFIPPSVIISLTSRLAWAEMKNNEYPNPIGVNEFRNRLKNETFKKKLEQLIGDDNSSTITDLFRVTLGIFESKDIPNILHIPPVLIKDLFNNSTELLLMILQWLKYKDDLNLDVSEKRNILATFTALRWFGRDNTRYVRELWNDLKLENPWNKKTLQRPYYRNNKYIMYPLVSPSDLREFLIEKIVKKGIVWDDLYTKQNEKLNDQYSKILKNDFGAEEERQDIINEIWKNFINKLIYCKPLLLFAQREFINKNFGDFNQLETLEDTNAPWDWDHIYPQSWVYYKQKVNNNIRHWIWTIGNIRAISLEDNRSENNLLSPSKRLFDVESNSVIEGNFIKDDWEYWKKIEGRINEDEKKKINILLSAIINRLCNIYEDWYMTLKVGDLFGPNIKK